MKDIKIFVSNRTDMESRAVPNDIFVPIRCGAALDKRKNIDLLGDDTGDNISLKKKSYSELTVMYWIWKNVKADYVGLAHYRRFLSFASHDMPNLMMNMGHLSHMTEQHLYDMGLLNKEKLQNAILAKDWISARSYDIRTETIVNQEHTVWDFWQKFHPEYISKEAFAVLLETIEKMYPEYKDEVIELAKGTRFLGFNCCIGRKELYDDLCSFMFDVLFSVEKRLKSNMSHYSEQSLRVLGYMGEWLYTVWNFHLRKSRKYKMGERQLVMFDNTSLPQKITLRKKSCQVVMLADSSNLPAISVTVTSILDNSAAGQLFEFLLVWQGKTISVEDKNILSILRQATKKFNEKAIVTIVDPTTQIELDLSDVPEAHKKACLISRLPWILSGVKRIIYLDEKIIAKENIFPLYEKNIYGKSIGAVRDIFFIGNEVKSPHEHKSVGFDFMKNVWDYFSTDVLLMDLETLRKNYSLAAVEAWENFSLEGNKWLNQMYEHDVDFLGYEWNYFGIQDEEFKVMMLERIPADIKKEYDEVSTPVLLSFPSVCGQISALPFWTEYWQVARKSPFYEQLLRKCLSTSEEPVCIGVVGRNGDPRFVFPWQSVSPGSCIIIYGGGIVGKTFLRQLDRHPYCKVMAVCDRDPVSTGIVEAPVIGLSELTEIETSSYDVIIIALEREDIAMKARRDLEDIGIPPSKIKWIDPHRH